MRLHPEDIGKTVILAGGKNVFEHIDASALAKPDGPAAEDYPRVRVLERGGWATTPKGRIVRRLSAVETVLVALVKKGEVVEDRRLVVHPRNLQPDDGKFKPSKRKIPEAKSTPADAALADRRAAALSKMTGLSFQAMRVSGQWLVAIASQTMANSGFRISETTGEGAIVQPA